MAFRIKRKEPVSTAIKRIAHEQAEKAIAETEDQNLNPHETVHQVRKRCKKLRGLIRLVRPQFEETYQRENKALRDAARELSRIRDAEAAIENFDHFFENESRLKSIRKALLGRRSKLTEEVEVEELLRDFSATMRDFKQRIDSWELTSQQFESVSEGLVKTYKRGYKAMSQALKNPSTENFHEWRKRVKYHHYHSRILQHIWKKNMKVIIKETKRLSDILGDEHDTAVLKNIVLNDPELNIDNETVALFTRSLDQKRENLRSEAEIIGRRIYAEKARHLAKRYGNYWTAKQLEQG